MENFLESSRLRLVEIEETHASLLMRWANDPVVSSHLHDTSYPTRLEDQLTWIKDVKQDPYQKIFMLEHIAHQKIVGYGGLMRLNGEDFTAEVGLAIGEKEYWKQGLGTESAWLLCRYGFRVLGLFNIQAEHYALNVASLRTFQKIGFRYYGTRRLARLLAGQRWDVHYSDILFHELLEPDEW